MAGTRAGGLKAAKTIRKNYGKKFWKETGAKGGKASNTGGFASLVVGSDGLTGPERAKLVSRKKRKTNA